MDRIFSSSSLCIISLTLLTICRGMSGATFTLINRCEYTVWPGILANAGSSSLDSTGFELPPGGARSFPVPPNWSGRLWGRTGCTFDPSTGQGSCLTGDCSTNQVECNGRNANPPATLAEFTIQSGGQDFYDVSLVDGYNLPMIVEPNSGSGSCLSTGCAADINQQCPSELRVGSGDACKSACEAFGSPEYCCSGPHGSPDSCKPSVYSEMFKAACPRSYSFAYDDATSTFTYVAADYVITFCPLVASQKSARDSTAATSATSGSEMGSGKSPLEINSSWFPRLFAGGSSNTLSSSFPWSSFTQIVSTISILFLSSLYS